MICQCDILHTKHAIDCSRISYPVAMPVLYQQGKKSRNSSRAGGNIFEIASK